MASANYRNTRKNIFNPLTNYLNENASSKYRTKVATNVHLALENRRTGQHHYITPYELSVDTLQWAIDNGECYVSTDGYLVFGKQNSKSNTGNLTIGLKSILPSLLVETSSAPFKDTRRDELVDVYEGDDVPLLSREENLANYARGEFVFNLKYGDRLMQSSQNIDYVRKIAESLESSDASKWKCDLEGIPDEYVIIDEVRIGDEEYVICGYPDPKKMRQHIDLLRPQPVAKSLQEIHAEQRTASKIGRAHV